LTTKDPSPPSPQKQRIPPLSPKNSNKNIHPSYQKPNNIKTTINNNTHNKNNKQMLITDVL